MKLYEEVTADIVRQLEQGVKPWVKGWKSRSIMPFNAAKGTHYRGINILIFWNAAQKAGYPTHGWLGFKEAQALGATVRKGEKATRGVFVNFVEDEETKVKRAYTKFFFVFNVAQINNLPEVYASPPETKPPGFISELVDKSGITVNFGAQPCYIPALDVVECPPLADFVNETEYCSTLSHELVHATGHPKRLNRNMGKEDYALEECVAELGSAFVTSTLGLSYTDAQSPAYLDHWLKVLKQDSRALFTIASQASKAADWLLKT